METDQVVIPKFTVKTLSGRSIQVELASELNNISDVKRVIEKECSLPIAKQTLISLGRVLLDHEPVPAAETIIFLFYYEPAALLADPIESAPDWETKNKLKVCKGLYLISRRKFSEAAPLLVDALTTFNDAAFISFKDLVRFTAISAMLILDRPSIATKLVKSPEVLEVLDEIPFMKDYINSLYNCRYKEFFAALASMEGDLMKNWLFAPHTQYVIKEMRIRAYTQMLQSYKSLSIQTMAQSFGVSNDFIDM